MHGQLAVPTAAALFALLATATGAQTIDPDASVVHLRKTCDVANCFTTTSDLTTWLWGDGPDDRTNEPSSGDRVAVHVGPGDFGPFECTGTDGSGGAVDRGYVGVIGSGRKQTSFVRSTPDGGVSGACVGAVHIENCQEMDFSHLSARGETGVFWLGGGEATWSDVDMIGSPQEPRCGLASQGWYDQTGVGGKSKHFMFGSRAIGRGELTAMGLNVPGAEIWFYGGDVLAKGMAETMHNVTAAHSVGAGDIRFFGTTIRTQLAEGIASGPSRFNGAEVRNGGTLHMHGGIINASAHQGTGDVDVFGIRAEGSGTFAHSPDTAFVVRAGGDGLATRVESVDGATVQSPFLWPAGTTPPDAASLHGSDAFVETDAGASGDEAHMMVRDSSCSAGGGPWRDMATGSCRP